jgi:hypothetical protein
MGADMCVAVVLQLKNDERGTAERINAMVAEAEKSPFNPADWGEFYEICGEKVPRSNKVFEDANATITDYFDVADGRQATSITHPRGQIIVTGGLSWGDAPTDAYDAVQRFGCLPERVLNAGGYSGRLG